MIYAELSGGLGNQMFIYAFARALGLRCGEAVTLLDRQDWRDGAPAHTACALGALALSPDVAIVAEPGFAKAHLPLQNAAKALMIKYEQKSGMLSRDRNRFERRAAPFLNTLGLHFATDGYVPVRRGLRGIFWHGDIFRARRILPMRRMLSGGSCCPDFPRPLRQRARRCACICAGGITRTRKTPSYRYAPPATTPARCGP